MRWLWRRLRRRPDTSGVAAHDEARRLALQARRSGRRVDAAARSTEDLAREIEAALALRRRDDR